MAPPNLSLLLIMACFWAIYVLVVTQFVRPLGSLLDERERRAREARAAFEAAQRELGEGLAASERALAAAAAEAQRDRAATRAQGEQSRREALEAARHQGQQQLAHLAGELDAASEGARTELRQRARQLAGNLAERLLGRRLAS